MPAPILLAADDPEFAERAAVIQLAVFDFDGVFTDNCVYVDQDGRESVRCWRGDGFGFRRLEKAGVVPVILSTETSTVVARRAEKLGIQCWHGLDDKAGALDGLLADRGIESAVCAYVGNDINDAPCLARAGLALIVADAHPEVATLADYITQAMGGRGAVREVCDVIAAARRRV